MGRSVMLHGAKTNVPTGGSYGLSRGFNYSRIVIIGKYYPPFPPGQNSKNVITNSHALSNNAVIYYITPFTSLTFNTGTVIN
jgi:hypothetical protein